MSLRSRILWFLASAFVFFIMTAHVVQRLLMFSHRLSFEKAVVLVLAATIVVGVIFIVFFWIFLQKTILTPISKLTRFSVLVRENNDLSLRPLITRTDEIGILSREMDHMVQRLQETHSEVDRKLKAEINGHRKTEESLRRHQEFLDQLFENSPYGIAVLDNNNRFLNVNQEFERIFQYKLDEIMGENIDEYIVPKEKSDEATDLAARAQKGNTVHLETVRKRKDGELVDVMLHGVPIHLDTEQIGIYGIYMDISARMRSERKSERLKDQLIEAKKMESVGTLAGGMAHEFNNLMAIILGNVEMLINAGVEDKALFKRMEAIRASAERSATLTDQLLSFSRKQMFKLEILDINELIANIGYMIKNVFGEAMKQEITFAPDLPKVEGDQGQLTQVFMDIVRNARDAMPEKGVLRITTENIFLDEEQCKSIPESCPGSFVCVSVSDTGTGIDAETLKHIFEPFFTTKRFKNATGLGLSFVYGTIKQHSGWIDVNSEVGKGTTFKIYLPAFDGGLENRA
jgi:two-component system cell cycle sensor histidine kinase/response regulator CckA